MVLLRVALFPPPPHFPLSLKMAYILSALHFFSQSLFPPHPCKCPAPLKHLDSIPLPCCSHLPSFWTQSCGHSFSFSEYLITSLLPISLPLLCHLSLKTTNSMETHFLEIHFLDVLISNHLVFYLYQVPHPNFTTPITTSPQKHQLYGHEIILTTPPKELKKSTESLFIVLSCYILTSFFIQLASHSMDHPYNYSRVYTWAPLPVFYSAIIT